MSTKTDGLHQLVEWLQNGTIEKQKQAALSLRNLAGDVNNKTSIKQAGGIEALLTMLDSGPENVLTVIAAETLSCLAADDQENREAIREAGGIQQLVNLLKSGPEADCTHRALLALRLVTNCEADRTAILKAGGIPALVKLLTAGPDNEITEYSAAALGNLAAGGHTIKDAIRTAGGIEPLVKLLRDNPKEISAELAAVALRNMALQNSPNRQAILEADGLQPLLQLLSAGQERLVTALPCEVVYNEISDFSRAGTRKFVASQCCFDPRRAELCIAAKVADAGVLGCFTKTGKYTSPRDKSAERYSLLRKLTLMEPEICTLEILFTVAGMQGASRVAETSQKLPTRQLERIIISPCAATEIKGAIMRMLTKTHLEREFDIGQSRPASMSTLSSVGFTRASVPHCTRAGQAVAAQ